MSWLPPEPPSERPVGRTWQPPSLQGVDVGELVYVVVEEILEGGVTVLVSDWPVLDDEGRLHFGAEPPVEITMDVERLERFLAEHRLPTDLGDRSLRVGDTFALRPRRSLREVSGDGTRLEPEEWVTPPVYDITADARDVAKTAFFGAVTPTLEPATVHALQEIVEPPPAQPAGSVRPGHRLSLRWLGASVLLAGAGVAAGVIVSQAVGNDTTTVAGTTRTSTSTSTTTTTVFTTVFRETTPPPSPPAPPPPPPTPIPDLTVSISGGPLVGPDGTQVDFVVTDGGDADVTSLFEVTTTLTPLDPQFPTQEETQTIEGLAAGASQSVTQVFPEDKGCGAVGCTATITVDPVGAIPESNDDNNTDTSTLEPPPPPD